MTFNNDFLKIRRHNMIEIPPQVVAVIYVPHFLNKAVLIRSERMLKTSDYNNFLMKLFNITLEYLTIPATKIISFNNSASRGLSFM